MFSTAAKCSWRTCFLSRIRPSISDGIFQIKYPVKMRDKMDEVTTSHPLLSYLKAISVEPPDSSLLTADGGRFEVDTYSCAGSILCITLFPHVCAFCIFSTPHHPFQSLPCHSCTLLPLLFLRPLLTSQTLLNIVFFLTFRCSLTSFPFSALSLQPFSHKLDPNPPYRYHALRPY